MHKAIYYIYIIPLFFSAIFSLRAFRLKWPLPYRCFSVFLFVTLLVECFAILWKDYLFLHSTAFWNFSNHNIWLYNVYFIPQYLFYLFFYRSVLNGPVIKKIINTLIPVFAVFAILNISVIQGLYTPNNYTLAACCVIMLLLVTCYFYQLLRQKKIIQLSHEPLVWISFGAFFFHLGCLPFFVWFNTLVVSSPAKAFSFLAIDVVLNSVMYSSYSIAFLWNKNFYR